MFLYGCQILYPEYSDLVGKPFFDIRESLRDDTIGVATSADMINLRSNIIISIFIF